MFSVITLVLLVFIWTRPSTSIGFLGKVALTAMTLAGGCCGGCISGMG